VSTVANKMVKPFCCSHLEISSQPLPWMHHTAVRCAAVAISGYIHIQT